MSNFIILYGGNCWATTRKINKWKRLQSDAIDCQIPSDKMNQTDYHENLLVIKGWNIKMYLCLLSFNYLFTLYVLFLAYSVHQISYYSQVKYFKTAINILNTLQGIIRSVNQVACELIFCLHFIFNKTLFKSNQFIFILCFHFPQILVNFNTI